MLTPAALILFCLSIGAVAICSALFLPPNPPKPDDDFRPLPETERLAGETNPNFADRPDRITILGVRLSVVMYLAACALPALRFGEQQPGVPGGLCLIALPFVLFTPYWYANPAFCWGLAAYLTGQRSTAAASALLAAFLASTFFGLLWIEPLADALNHPQVLIGAWIWVGSLWLFAALAWRDVSRHP